MQLNNLNIMINTERGNIVDGIRAIEDKRPVSSIFKLCDIDLG